MIFVVQSKSSGSEYTVRAQQGPNGPTIVCSCAAGEKGQACKHRLALLAGEDGEVIRSDATVAELAEMIEGTALEVALAEVEAREADVKAAQANVRAAKKHLAAVMFGRA